MRFGYITIALFAIFCGLLVGARAVGALIPYANSLEALGFSVCDGKPCYRGITPGITTWNEVLQNFPEENFDSVEEEGLAIKAGKVTRTGDRCSRGWLSLFLDRGTHTDGTPLIVKLGSSFSCQADRVVTIDTGLDNNDFRFSSLDQLIAIYGDPCAFYLHEPERFPATFFLEYPEMMVRVTVFPGEPTYKFPLEEIKMGQNANAGIMGGCDQDANVYIRWHGFASIDYYRTMQDDSIQLWRKANP